RGGAPTRGRHSALCSGLSYAAVPDRRGHVAQHPLGGGSCRDRCGHRRMGWLLHAYSSGPGASTSKLVAGSASARGTACAGGGSLGGTRRVALLIPAGAISLLASGATLSQRFVERAAAIAEQVERDVEVACGPYLRHYPFAQTHLKQTRKLGRIHLNTGYRAMMAHTHLPQPQTA